MEMEFVHSVNISKEKAPEIKKIAEDNEVILTCHAPFFINLNSNEPAKLNAKHSKNSEFARITNLCGGYSTCFHAGFYQGKIQESLRNIKKAMKEIVSTLKKKIIISDTTGDNGKGNAVWRHERDSSVKPGA